MKLKAHQISPYLHRQRNYVERSARTEFTANRFGIPESVNVNPNAVGATPYAFFLLKKKAV